MSRGTRTRLFTVFETREQLEYRVYVKDCPGVVRVGQNVSRPLSGDPDVGGCVQTRGGVT